ncbi:MAG: manganese efflux pump MntP family protein [Oscillospiraceae bacterium]|jgi:putative Mn2+ efflux pump MntP|nr:manganese efflux pump MntP family protein [Oscillospiraceae bacterium]
MQVFSQLLLAVGLAMDAFSVAICKGLAIQKRRWVWAGAFGLCFGGFQVAMPLLGWLLGTRLERYIVSVDHWIVFGLLLLLGGKMLWEALHPEGEGQDCNSGKPVRLRELLLLGVATSIDALAAGITFALLQINIWLTVALIGAVTFVLSALGVLLGGKIGTKMGNKAMLLGGAALILLGVKTLLEHLLGG